MNEKHCIVEIDTGGSSQWLSISSETNTTEKLNFIKASEEVVNGNKMNVRTFEGAELRFDKSFGKLVVRENGYILMNCSEELIPSEIDKLISKSFT
jgi:hypothetical protein